MTTKKKPGPRNPGPSEEQRDLLLAAAQRGATNRDAAALAGIAESTFYKWLSNDDYADFADAYTRAKATGRMRSIRLIADSDDWRAHAWLLERVDPEHWGKAETDGTRLADKLSGYLAGLADAGSRSG